MYKYRKSASKHRPDTSDPGMASSACNWPLGRMMLMMPSVALPRKSYRATYRAPMLSQTQAMGPKPPLKLKYTEQTNASYAAHGQGQSPHKFLPPPQARPMLTGCLQTHFHPQLADYFLYCLLQLQTPTGLW